MTLYPQLLLNDPFEGELPQEPFILTCCIEFEITYFTLNHKWERPSVSYRCVTIRLVFVFGLNDEAAIDVRIFNVFAIAPISLVDAQFIECFGHRLLRITTHVVVDSQFLGLVIEYKESFVKIKIRSGGAASL